MAFSQAYQFFWITGAVFVVLPHRNLGLLSDYKICADSECESLMSRVQAVRDYRSKDCRFLSFRRGDTIFVYHKLTGKREDLWAGSIDKQFGYFPKDAVREEQVYATTEKVVETQKSDFFCEDEFGYLIDSTHLDTDGDDSDQDIQIQESEITQIPPHTDDTKVESPLMSADPSSEYLVSAEEAEGDENKNVGDAADEEVDETPATLSGQGGSPSSSWLGSSVTGWFGLAKEEQTVDLAEGEEEEERKETQAEASLTSSATAWLGFGGGGKPEDAKESVQISDETADSLTSTMTGWLGFGGEKKTDSGKKEGDEEKEEPEEKFRSRRMSLDLEASQLHEEEKEEMGTLGWLGNGLSNTLGFGLTNQESGHETSSGGEEAEEEKEQMASSSWLDMGIMGIIGLKKDDTGVDESAGSAFNKIEMDATIQQPIGSQNVDSSQSQPALTGEGKIEYSNESPEEEAPKDQNVPSTEAVNADNNKDTPDSSKGSVLHVDAASTVDNKDISPQFEEKSEAAGGMSSMSNSFFQTSDEEDDDKEKNKADKEISAGIEDVRHQMPTSKGSEDINREAGQDEIKTPTPIDQDFITQPDSIVGPSSVDLKSNSMGETVDEVEEDEKDQLQCKKTEEEEVKIPNQTDNMEESTDKPVEAGTSGDDREGEGSNEGTELPHREISTTQSEESAEESQVSGDAEDSSTQSQLVFSSAEERNEPTPGEDDSFTPHTAETNVDDSDTPAVTDNNAETQTCHGESEEFRYPSSTSRSPEGLDENALEEDRGTIFSNASTPNTYQATVSPQIEQRVIESESDGDKLKEADKETATDSSSSLLQVQTETGISSSETETEKVEDSKDWGKQEMKEGKENEQQEVNEEKEEGKQEGVDGVKDGEQLEEVGESNEEKKQDKSNKVKKTEGEMQQEVEEEKQEGRQDEVEEVEEMQQEVSEIKEGKQEEVKGDEDMEKEKGEEIKEVKEERRQVEVEELKGEKNQQKTEELLEDEKQARVEELKEEEKQEELKEKEEGEGKQVQSSYSEVQTEKIENGISSPETESNETSLRSPFTETAKQTESPQPEEEKRTDEKTKQEEVGEVKDDKMEREEVEEKRQETHGEDDNSLKCSNELCPKAGKVGPVIEGGGESSEDGASSAGEGTIQTGKQKDHADRTVEKDERTNKTKSEITEISSTGISDHAEESVVVRGNGDTDVQMSKTVGAASWELSVSPTNCVECQAVTSEQTAPHTSEDPTRSSLPPDDHSRGSAEGETGGAFGLFKNAFGFFSQTPTTETPQSTQSFNTNLGETSQPQASLTSDQELDSTTDSSQVQDVHTDSPIATSTEQPQPYPPTAQIDLHTASLNADVSFQTKKLSKHYKNLLAHMSVDETTVLMELFGQHKLQFLDFILASSEVVTKDADDDESILSDIERLLHHHREMLVAPSMRLVDAPQEDKEKTRMLIALQKLEMLLERVREAFNTGKSDVSNQQAEVSRAAASCSTRSTDKKVNTEEESRKMQDSHAGQDNNIHKDERMAEEEDRTQVGRGNGKEMKTVDKKTGEKERSDEEGASLLHSQPLEGVVKQILDSTSHIHAVRALLITEQRQKLSVLCEVWFFKTLHL